MDRRTKKLNIFYWVLVALVGLALIAEMYAAAAFLTLVLIVSQLSEIATYLQILLKARTSRGEDADGT
jgi:predicted membrane channel-forming protein YqfA (hemolysin III family)